MLFSDRWRGWKFLSALLLLVGGCLYNYHYYQTAEPAPWTYAMNPERFNGRPLWLMAQSILLADPEHGILEVRPHGYLLKIHVPPGNWPEGAEAGTRLYARLRFDRQEGFILEEGARSAPAQKILHLDLYLVSIPAAVFVLVCMARHFRPKGWITLEPREDTHA